MPTLLLFNKGIKKTDGQKIPDNLSYVIRPDYYNRIRIINIQFEEGFRFLETITIKTNSNKDLILKEYRKAHNLSSIMLDINDFLPFIDGKNIELELVTECVEPIKFKLNYRYV